MTAVAAVRGFFAIPPGTKESRCDRCHQSIWWIEHRSKPRRKGEIGKLSHLPISVKDNVHAQAPTDTTWGQGPSHFPDCPFAAMYRRQRA